MLQRRRNTYASRVIIPADLRAVLGRVEITRSLRTGSRPEALRRLALWESRVRSYLSVVRRNAHSMTRAELDSLSQRYLEAAFEEIEGRLSLDWDEPGLDAHRFDLIEEAERLSAALATTDYAVGMDWARGFLPAAGEETLRKLARRLIEAKLEAIQAELAALRGEPLRIPDLIPMAPTVAEVAATPASTPRLSELVAKYCEERISRQDWSSRTAVQYREIFSVLLDLLGDPEVGAVTKAHMRQLSLDLMQFPSNSKKRFPAATPSEALARAIGDESVARLKPASINMYQQAARSVFKWAMENDLIQQNPASVMRDMKTGNPKYDRLPFTDDDLRSYFGVLEAERESQPCLWWIPRIMAFSGCRLGEAAQLRKEDVRQEAGVWVLDINENHPDKQLKTAASRRLVPLHPELARMGFLPFLQQQPEGFLWPETMRKATSPERSPIDKLQRMLATRLRSAGISDKKKTAAHSFRHTVSARLKGCSVPDYQIAEILGHENDSLTTGRYGATTDLAHLSKALSQLQLPI